jgi:ABC-type transporter Mla subunit MlaD
MANLTADLNVYHYFSPDPAQLGTLIADLTARVAQLEALMTAFADKIAEVNTKLDQAIERSRAEDALVASLEQQVADLKARPPADMTQADLDSLQALEDKLDSIARDRSAVSPPPTDAGTLTPAPTPTPTPTDAGPGLPLP